MLRRAPYDELLGDDDDEEEGDAEERRDDVRRPEVLRLEAVVLREVEDRAAEAPGDGRGRLADDRADDARRGRDLERREEIGEGGREAELPQHGPRPGCVRAHELDRAMVGGLQAAERGDRDR